MTVITRVTAGLALLASMSSACMSQSSDSLVFTIEQALVTSPRAADFGRAVEGDWDRVCIFRPRTTYERVDSVLGESWPAVRQTGLETTDDATLIAFVRGTDVLSHVMYPIAKGDFGTPGPEQWYCRSRGNAVFELRQPIDGSIPWIGPASGTWQEPRPRPAGGGVPRSERLMPMLTAEAGPAPGRADGTRSAAL
ncbi:MAG: hypothetical protein KFH98_09805 [Gemmatimonadetes bacterium]|nr:hypothetical protein [Gemmatimonadota bacterium]